MKLVVPLFYSAKVNTLSGQSTKVQARGSRLVSLKPCCYWLRMVISRSWESIRVASFDYEAMGFKVGEEVMFGVDATYVLNPFPGKPTLEKMQIWRV